MRSGPCLVVRRPLVFGGWPASETSVSNVDQCGQKCEKQKAKATCKQQTSSHPFVFFFFCSFLSQLSLLSIPPATASTTPTSSFKIRTQKRMHHTPSPLLSTLPSCSSTHTIQGGTSFFFFFLFCELKDSSRVCSQSSVHFGRGENNIFFVKHYADATQHEAMSEDLDSREV